MTFVYTEWDPITTNFATQNDTYTGIFLLKEDDEMVPFIDDPVATLQNYGSLEVHQYFTSIAPIPVGNWMPFFSELEVWHLSTLGNDLQRYGGLAVFKVEKQLTNEDVLDFQEKYLYQDYELHLSVVDWTKLSDFNPTSLDSYYELGNIYNSLEIGIYEGDFTQAYVAPNSSTGIKMSSILTTLAFCAYFLLN